jgi:hypothetical protein
MKLTLDRQALANLIDNDPKFEGEIKATVLSEVVRRLTVKDTAAIAKALEPEMFERAVEAARENAQFGELVNKAVHEQITSSSPHSYSYSPTPRVQEMVNKATESAVKQIQRDIFRRIDTMVAELVQAAVEAKFEEMGVSKMVEDSVNRQVDHTFETLVNQGVECRLTQALTSVGIIK